MAYGAIQSTTTTGLPVTGSPYARIDRDYTYGGWSGGNSFKSGSKGSSNAALSALALISFLFFLNLLQQQLSSGQQQTLLFMVNNSASSGRRRRDAPDMAETFDSPPDEFDIMLNSLENLRLETEEEDEEKGTSSPPTVPKLRPPDPAPAPPTREAILLWMNGLLPTTQLPLNLADALSNCRAVVACTVHRVSNFAPSVMHQNTIRGILLEVGQATNGVDGVDDACEDLLATAAASGECNELTRTITELMPELPSQQFLKHEPHDLL